jgi:hypothetical protein
VHWRFERKVDQKFSSMHPSQAGTFLGQLGGAMHCGWCGDAIAGGGEGAWMGGGLPLMNPRRGDVVMKRKEETNQFRRDQEISTN